MIPKRDDGQEQQQNQQQIPHTVRERGERVRNDMGKGGAILARRALHSSGQPESARRTARHGRQAALRADDAMRGIARAGLKTHPYEKVAGAAVRASE